PESEIELCQSGFHFCRYPLDVLEYYNEPHSVYARVTALGTVIDGYDKSVTNQIRVDELMSRDQLLNLMPNYIHRLDGTGEWYQKGLRHRLDGPAIEYYDGSEEWYQNGQLH